MTIATEHKFGEILNNDSGSSTCLEDTRWNSLTQLVYMGTNIKGRVFANNGEFVLWTRSTIDTHCTFKMALNVVAGVWFLILKGLISK